MELKYFKYFHIYVSKIKYKKYSSRLAVYYPKVALKNLKNKQISIKKDAGYDYAGSVRVDTCFTASPNIYERAYLIR